MRNSKKVLSIILALVIIVGTITCYPSQTEAASKNGCYMFASMGKLKISNNCLVVKNGSTVYMSYGRKSFQPYSEAYKIYGSYKFKLNKKIYVFDREYPSHKVKKFGVKFDVSHGRYESRAKFMKRIKNCPTYICCYLIVKNGKVVAYGTSA